MLKDYITLDLESGMAYLRMDRLDDLRVTDALIFDCDGVLVDIRDSYDKAILKAVTYIFEGLTGYVTPKSLVSDEVIFLFRRSGGFNNDWDIVYGILMFLICELPKNAREKLEDLMRALINEKNVSKRLPMMREGTNIEKIDAFSQRNLKDRLRDFTSLLDVSGVASVDRAILSAGKVSESFYSLLKKFLHGSEKVGESIIATVFEEIFYGSDLFTKTYDLKPAFYNGRGMIENEKPIIKYETLSCLALILGEIRFGIASGSRFKSAEYVLRDLLDWFSPGALVFLDDVEMAEREYAGKGLKTNLKKPNPFSLFKSAKGLKPFRLALYVGDSMEDVIMVDEARKTDPRFLFAGVYGYSNLKETVVREFLKYGCDVILPSVNEIPIILESVGR